MKSKRQLAIFGAMIVILIGLVPVEICADGEHQLPYGETIVSQGQFGTLKAGRNKKIKISGWVQMVRHTNGKTDVSVYVQGLAANTTYPTHIHTMPCELGGGDHYKIFPEETGTSEVNEIWPTVHTNAQGVGIAKIRVRHWARSDAQSIVIHDPKDKSKIACADIYLVSSRAMWE